jgi:hypothetical protein
MAAYIYSSEHKAFIKKCPKCKEIYVGHDNESKAIMEFNLRFASDKYCPDGFYGTCRTCVSEANQSRRKGREDCDPKALLIKQGGKCAICKTSISLRRNGYSRPTSALVDHCHETGKIRGLLCMACNFLVGHLERDQEIVTKALSYMHQERTTIKRDD